MRAWIMVSGGIAFAGAVFAQNAQQDKVLKEEKRINIALFYGSFNVPRGKADAS